MTKKTKLNYYEVLHTNLVSNFFTNSPTNGVSQKVMNRCNGFVKYLFKSNMGSIDRLLNTLKKEYATGCTVMQDMLHEDYDADAKGGYGRGAYELKSGFGFPTNIDDLNTKLEDTQTCIDVLESFMEFNQDDYEIVFGSRFEANLSKDKQSSSNSISSSRKEELRKKYEVAK